MRFFSTKRSSRPGSGLKAGAFVAVLGIGSSAPAGYEEVRALLSRDPSVRAEAARRLTEEGDPSVLAALNDVLYYHYVVRDGQAAAATARVMEAIAATSVGPNPRRGWAEWVGAHAEIRPRPGYVAFKASLFARYDPAFQWLLSPTRPFRIRPEEIEWGGVGKDGIPALDEPRHVPAREASYLRPDDRVFGVVVGGEARAYPHRILDWHEMCNDVVGGVPVALSYCTLCGSGILFDRRVARRRLTFGSSGLLYRSNKLMVDAETGSLWRQLTGEPVVGPFADSGVRLAMLPLVVTSWGEWRRRHPETLVLDIAGTGFRRDYDRSPYEEYFRSDETMFPVWLRSDRRKTKEWVYGLVVGGRAKAYPVSVLRREGIAHDRIGGVDLVLVTEETTGAVRAYRTDGRRFRRGSTRDELVDEAGARWRVDEEALVGPAPGGRFERVAGHRAYWFGWFAFHPATDLYEPSSP